jgi:LysR family nitrogen assimilation transcriptional regulator
MVPRVVAEIESSVTLASAVASGVGATVLPESAARSVAALIPSQLCRIVSPAVEVPLVLCTSDHLPLSEPAQAVRIIVLELVEDLDPIAGLHSIH